MTRKIALGIGIFLLAAPAALLLIAHLALNDHGVRVARDLYPADAPRVAMAVFAHPDDEITSAGTLARMARSGRVILVYLTRGEAYRHPAYDAETLAQVRTEEARAAGARLGAAETIVLDFPDSGLADADGAAARRLLHDLISAHRPSVLVSFDERVGFYGHPDHAQAGRWTREVFDAEAAIPGSPVRALYQATLPRGAIAIARQISGAFRENFPAGPARGLPAASVAIDIASEAAAKRALLDIHASQVAVIRDVQPGYQLMPGQLYYRVLNKEYFAAVHSRGLRPRI